MADLHDGDSFACVTAKNSAGALAASNSGYKLSADRSSPSVPAKPTGEINANSNIAVDFHWTKVSDVGPAGLSHYLVEVTNSNDANDVTTTPVSEETTFEKIGFDGITYYARVKAVDNAGNESDWSPKSDGVTVHEN